MAFEEPSGRPDLSMGLTPDFWFWKWLPDPPPDVRDAMLLAHAYRILSVLEDPGLRKALQEPVREALQSKL